MAPHPHCNGDAIFAAAKPRLPVPARYLPRWRLMLLLGCAATLWLANEPVSAQTQKPAPTLIVSSQLVLTPDADSKLDIAVVPPSAIPPRSVIVIRGVPEGMHLTSGRPFGPGVWVTPATQLVSVKLHLPVGGRGAGVLTVALTTLEGVSIAEARVNLLTAPPSLETAAQTASPPAGPDDAPTSATQATTEPQSVRVPRPTPENRAELVMLLERGKDSFRLGNILHARQFYQRAAEKGLAEAAFALAATYDPVELARMKSVVGVAPDMELATKWYEKARQLGSPDAAARLAALGRP